MKILITGSSGFIGTNLARELSKTHEIGIIVRPNSQLSAELIENISAKYIYDGHFDSVNQALAQFQPGIVIHLASYYVYEHKPEEVDILLESNLKIGAYILEAMKLNGVKKLINTGTSFEHFGEEASSAVNLYAATKQAFGDLCKYYCDAGHMSVVTLKLFDTYGEGDERKKLLNLLKEIAQNKNELLLSPGDQLIDILHISDLLNAYNIALEQLPWGQGTYQEFGLSSDQRCSLKDLVAMVEKITEQSLNIKWGARPYRDREVMVPWESFAQLPGWTAKISLEDGLQRFLNQ